MLDVHAEFPLRLYRAVFSSCVSARYPRSQHSRSASRQGKMTSGGRVSEKHALQASVSCFVSRKYPYGRGSLPRDEGLCRGLDSRGDGDGSSREIFEPYLEAQTFFPPTSETAGPAAPTGRHRGSSS